MEEFHAKPEKINFFLFMMHVQIIQTLKRITFPSGLLVFVFCVSPNKLVYGFFLCLVLREVKELINDIRAVEYRPHAYEDDVICSLDTQSFPSTG